MVPRFVLTYDSVQIKIKRVGKPTSSDVQQPVGSRPAESAAISKKENPDFAKVIKDVGIKLGN